MSIVLNDKTEREFRKTVYETKGYKKGNISEAFEEAVECWIKKQIEQKEK